jgi:uncharacterized protein involved in exopolysaccharide biosynthesis
VQTARRVSAGEATYASDLVKEQLDQARQRMEDAQKSLRDYRQQAKVEGLRKEVEMRLGLGTAVAFMDDPLRARGLLDGILKIAAERARLASAERELGSRPRPSVPDTVFQGLETAVTSARSSVAALEQQQAELTRSHPLDQGSQKSLDRLYVVEAELARRDVERMSAEKIYMDLAQKYQESRLLVIGKSAEFVVIDRAVPADRPMPRHVARNVVGALTIWLSFAMAGVLVFDSVRRRRATS